MRTGLIQALVLLGCGLLANALPGAHSGASKQLEKRVTCGPGTTEAYSPGGCIPCGDLNRELVDTPGECGTCKVTHYEAPSGFCQPCFPENKKSGVAGSNTCGPCFNTHYLQNGNCFPCGANLHRENGAVDSNTCGGCLADYTLDDRGECVSCGPFSKTNIYTGQCVCINPSYVPRTDGQRGCMLKNCGEHASANVYSGECQCESPLYVPKPNGALGCELKQCGANAYVNQYSGACTCTNAAFVGDPDDLTTGCQPKNCGSNATANIYTGQCQCTNASYIKNPGGDSTGCTLKNCGLPSTSINIYTGECICQAGSSASNGGPCVCATGSTFDTTTQKCKCAGTDKGIYAGACRQCQTYFKPGRANGDGSTCSDCVQNASKRSVLGGASVCHCSTNAGFYGGKCVSCNPPSNNQNAVSTAAEYGDKCPPCRDTTKTRNENTGVCETAVLQL